MSVRGWFYTGYLALLAALVFLAVSCSDGFATNRDDVNDPAHVYKVTLDNGRTIDCISVISSNSHGDVESIDCDWSSK